MPSCPKSTGPDAGTGVNRDVAPRDFASPGEYPAIADDQDVGLLPRLLLIGDHLDHQFRADTTGVS